MRPINPVAKISHAEAWTVLRQMAFVRAQYSDEPTELDFAGTEVRFQAGVVNAMVSFTVPRTRFDARVPEYAVGRPTWLSWLELVGIETMCAGGRVAVHRVPPADDVEGELELLYYQLLATVIAHARQAEGQHGDLEA